MIDGWPEIEAKEYPTCATYIRKPRAKPPSAPRSAEPTTGPATSRHSPVPDQIAPIVRNSVDGERELVMARWGMPGPPKFGGQPVTNVRN
jgi:putative SOS response-associated peptidase YedK